MHSPRSSRPWSLKRPDGPSVHGAHWIAPTIVADRRSHRCFRGRTARPAGTDGVSGPIRMGVSRRSASGSRGGRRR